MESWWSLHLTIVSRLSAIVVEPEKALPVLRIDGACLPRSGATHKAVLVHPSASFYVLLPHVDLILCVYQVRA